jgi:hypothetical protein
MLTPIEQLAKTLNKAYITDKELTIYLTGSKNLRSSGLKTLYNSAFHYDPALNIYFLPAWLLG